MLNWYSGAYPCYVWHQKIINKKYFNKKLNKVG